MKEKEYFSLAILLLALGGAIINLASICILTGKRLNTVFHNLLKILALYDLVVVIGCALLYAMPTLWPFFKSSLYPRILPSLLPVVQIAMMSSIYCTVVMSFERYIRICHLCQLRDCNYRVGHKIWNGGRNPQRPKF